MVIVGFQGVLPTFDDCGVWDANRTANGKTQSNAALDNMFTLATSAINISSLFVGFYIARFGPRVACATGGIVITSGALIFAFASQLQIKALWTAGYVIMASGGPFVCFSMFTLPPSVGVQHQALVFSLVIGSLDASALVMYILNVIHEQTGACEKDLFIGFAVLPLLLLPLSLWLFPRQAGSDETARQRSVDSINSALLANGSRDATLNSEDNYTSLSESVKVEETKLEGPWVKGEEVSTGAILMSSEFALAILWAGMFVTSKYFYMENTAHCPGLQAARRTGAWASKCLHHGARSRTVYAGDRVSSQGRHCAYADAYGLYTSIDWNYERDSRTRLVRTMLLLVFNRFFFFAAAPIVLTKLWGSRGIAELYGIQLFLAAVMNLSNFLWTYVTNHVTHGSFFALNLILNMTTFIVALLFAYKVRSWRNAKMASASASVSGVSYA